MPIKYKVIQRALLVGELRNIMPLLILQVKKR